MQCFSIDQKKVLSIVFLSYCIPFWLDNLLIRQASLPLSYSSLEVLTRLILPCIRLRRTKGLLNILLFIIVEIKLGFIPPIDVYKDMKFHPSLLPPFLYVFVIESCPLLS